MLSWWFAPIYGVVGYLVLVARRRYPGRVFVFVLVHSLIGQGRHVVMNRHTLGDLYADIGDTSAALRFYLDARLESEETGDFEATLSWAVGLDRQAPFTATELSAPTRVVVDIASGMGIRANRDYSVYSAAKTGLMRLTEAVGRVLATKA